MNTTDPTVWPLLTYRDAQAAMDFLRDAFGFVQTASDAGATDPSVVEHAELRWPEGGGVMLGSANRGTSPFSTRRTGNDAVYVVCTDPEWLFGRACDAGAQVVRALTDEGYGPCFTVLDPENNLWSFGTYAGAPSIALVRRQDFQSLLDDWAAAIVANDADRIASFAEPDWVLVTPESGPRPLDAFLTLVASGDLVHTDMTFEVLDVRVVSGAAMVLARGTNHGTWRGEPFAADEWVTEMFVRRAGRWRCAMSALTPNQARSRE